MTAEGNFAGRDAWRTPLQNEHEGAANSPARISIIMGVYNAEATLNEALESIEKQTFVSWELVVCDDASTDASWDILCDFAQRNERRTILLRNSENRKLAYSLNRCLQVATGPLIARMDADDVSVQNRLEVQAAFLERHPSVDLVGCAIQRFDEGGLKDVLSYPYAPDRWSLRKGVPFAHATILARRQVFNVLKGYTISKRTERSQDWDLWFRFFEANLVGRNMPEPLYRVREDREAVRRRTGRQRIGAWQTTMLGYRKLNFPAAWYVSATLRLLKIFVPSKAFVVYRQWQHFRYNRAHSTGGGTENYDGGP